MSRSHDGGGWLAARAPYQGRGVDLDRDGSIMADKTLVREKERRGKTKYSRNMCRGIFDLKNIMTVMGNYSFFLFSLINIKISKPGELTWSIRDLKGKRGGSKCCSNNIIIDYDLIVGFLLPRDNILLSGLHQFIDYYNLEIRLIRPGYVI
jgi:hypothetical protein